MKIIRKTLPVLFLAVLAAPAFAADTWVVDKNHSETTFTVRHLMSRVSGRFTDFAGTVAADAARPQDATVSFTVKAASIDTANENRDKHLRTADFFDVLKFPEITFKSTRITPRAKDAFDVTGNLTMHGVTREITLPVKFLGTVKDPGGNDKAGFETSVTLDRKDYGIVWNKALDAGGTLLSDDVNVTVVLQMAKKKEPAPVPAPGK